MRSALDRTVSRLYANVLLVSAKPLEPPRVVGVRDFPIVLVGTAYWCGLIDWLRDTAAAAGMISPGDLNLLQVTDDLDLVVDTALGAAVEHASEPLSRALGFPAQLG